MKTIISFFLACILFSNVYAQQQKPGSPAGYHPPVMILGNPANQVVGAGESAMFIAMVAVPPYLVWQKSTDGGFTWFNIPGTEKSFGMSPAPPDTLIIENVTDEMNNTKYRVHIASVYDEAYSGSALLTVLGKFSHANACVNDSFSLSSNLIGSNYQWQVNDKTGFININDGEIYYGTNTTHLNIKSFSPSFYGNYYRCIVDNADTGDIVQIKIASHWTGHQNSEWENVANWSCGNLPDHNTDVYIDNDLVILNSNVTVRSLSLRNNANVTCGEGSSLTIVH